MRLFSGDIKVEKKILDHTVAVEWDPAITIEGGQAQGRVGITHGRLLQAEFNPGQGSLQDGQFSFTTGGRTRLNLAITEARVDPGANATLVTIENDYRSFSFFLRDVTQAFPIYIPDCAVAVTTAGDLRSYAQIAQDIAQSAMRTRLQRIQDEPEETFENAAAVVRHQPNCPTWLGLSRDMRSFLVNFRQNGEVWDWIQPQFHSTAVMLPENEEKPVRYNFFIGRGVGCVQPVRRWLEDGALPILHAEINDGDIRYHATAFASLEYRPLLDANTGETHLRGTHYLVAESFGYGFMHTESQAQERDRRMPQEINRDEETVLYLRVEALNTASVPRYAWIKTPVPNAFHVGTTLMTKYQFMEGFASYRTPGGETGRIFIAARLDGAPLPQEEIALLLQPGEKAVVDIYLPHRPLSPARAAALAEQDFTARYLEMQAFWRGKLASAARVRLPEPRIHEMFQAGLLHLDLVTYGLEPDGVTAPCIGVYCPIGSESAPIVQFFDAMGWPELARRSLEYFIAKQHEDGFIQNFGGYMLETGAALWSLGEHYRLTRDDAWVKHIEPNLIKACDYLLRWSERNQREELRGHGYGLLDGKVGDPEDPYHIFMLNGYAFLGLARTAEMLAQTNPAESDRLKVEAEKLKGLIRGALEQAVARSPVVPLGDGCWVPTCPPWAEYRGPVALFAEGGNWFTHGAFITRDSLIGPLWLILQEVVGADEIYARWMLASHAELMTERNTAFSQPYYTPNAWAHLKRGEVKPFLKTYYNTVAALADRETYSFWEHFQLISPHKTHEEGWFLMQTRWMLYMEEGSTLRLMLGIPRRWLEGGKCIEIDGMASHFGRLKVKIESQVDRGLIRASIEVTGNADGLHRQYPLERVLLRLPHPQGKPALRCWSGESEPMPVYDREREIVTIEPWIGKAELTLEY
jgi:hypothetical protein